MKSYKVRLAFLLLSYLNEHSLKKVFKSDRIEAGVFTENIQMGSLDAGYSYAWGGTLKSSHIKSPVANQHIKICFLVSKIYIHRKKISI